MMKNLYLSLLALSIISSCTSSPEKQSGVTETVNGLIKQSSLQRTYYQSLDANKCMTVLFKDFDADSARLTIRTNALDAPADEPSEFEEQTTGTIDTTWFWKPNSEEEIRQRYKGLDPSQLNSHRVEYGITDCYRLDSVIALLYYVGNAPSPSNIGEGLAIFRKDQKGWFLSKNDYNFYQNVVPGKEIKRFEDAGMVNRKPAFLFVCESSNRYAPLSRQLLVVDYNLSLLTPPSNALFEVMGEGEMNRPASIRNSVLSMSVNRNATEAIANNMGIGSDYFVKFVLNTKGNVVGLKYYSNTTAKSKATNLKLLLKGSILENSVRFKEGIAGPNAYAPNYRIVGMWKNYAGGKSAFLTGTQFHAYAEGSLADSAKVRSVGQKKLLARQQISQREANDAAEFNQNANQEFQRMKDEQAQNQAVDKVVRDLGLCPYCSGKGCLQCGQTGRLQSRQ